MNDYLPRQGPGCDRRHSRQRMKDSLRTRRTYLYFWTDDRSDRHRALPSSTTGQRRCRRSGAETNKRPSEPQTGVTVPRKFDGSKNRTTHPACRTKVPLVPSPPTVGVRLFVRRVQRDSSRTRSVRQGFPPKDYTPHQWSFNRHETRSHLFIFCKHR